MQCQNNLKQIGLALHQYHDSYQLFPSNGGWDGKQTIPTADGSSQFTPRTFDKTAGGPYPWGVGDPMLGPRQQTGSWAYSILPYLEQEAMYRTREWSVPVKFYLCPSRRSPTDEMLVDEDDFGIYTPGGWNWPGRTDYAINREVASERPNCTPMSAFSDGLSNTIVVGEKAFDRLSQRTDNWYWDEPFFFGGSKGTSRNGIGLVPDGPGVPHKENWGSSHIGGVQFTFGDGSVRPVVFGTDPLLFPGLLTHNGGEVGLP